MVATIADLSHRFKPKNFPVEIFSEDIQQSFKELSEHYSVPLDFFCTTAIWAVSALSGNMYTTELNGQIKNIIYAMLIGPSGLGKSPAYRIICGNIVAPFEKKLYDDFVLAEKEWAVAKEVAKATRKEFNTPKPMRRIRTAQNGTVEGIMKHAQYTAAGFGMFYDEGGQMFGGPNQYKKDTSAIDFWNTMWNGDGFNDLRADESRERYIPSTSISTLAGMQTDRIGNYFTKDAMDSGVSSRFLVTIGDYINLNENIDYFSDKMKPCDRWQDLVKYLFNKGAYDYFKDDPPLKVSFTDDAREAYNNILNGFIKQSNINRQNRKVGDVSELMIKYDGKLFAYVGRFVLILSILNNPVNPVITVDTVSDAEKLYHYYRAQAELLFTKMNIESAMDLNENELRLFKNLPDEEFTTQEAAAVAVNLKMCENYFEVCFNRKFKKGWVKRVGRGRYIKE